MSIESRNQVNHIISNQSETINILKNTIKNLKSENHYNQSEIKDLIDFYKILKNQHLQLNSAYSKLRKNYNSLGNTYNSLTEEISKTCKENDQLKRTIKVLKDDLTELATEEGQQILSEMLEIEENEKIIRELQLKKQRAQIKKLSEELAKPKTRTERTQSL